MEYKQWQRREKAAGLSQKVLAKLLGHAEITVSRQLRGHWESGVPQHVKSAIIAWELMNDEQRSEWVERVAAEAESGG